MNEQQQLKDPIFKQWLPLLTHLATKGGFECPQGVWAMAEEAIARLKAVEPDERPSAAMLFYSDMCKRTPTDRVLPQLVMAVILTRLANATPTIGHPELNPHNEICCEIAEMMRGEMLFVALLEAFFARQRDWQGNKIVIPPSDCIESYTTTDDAPSNDDTTSSREIKAMVAGAIANGKLDELIYLENRLYSLKKPELQPLIDSIDKRKAELLHPQTITTITAQGNAIAMDKGATYYEGQPRLEDK